MPAKAKARLADEIDAGLAAHRARLLSPGWGSALENQVALMCPLGHIWMGAVGAVAKGTSGCTECEGSCSKEEATLTFILRHVFQSCFPTAREPLGLVRDLAARSFLLAMVVEHQGRHRFVYVPSFHEHFDEYAARVTRDKGITRLLVPSSLDFQSIAQHVITELKAREIPVAEVDWAALETEFTADVSAKASKSPRAAGLSQPVGRPTAPVWRWLTDELSPHTKAASRCFYCGKVIRHNRGNSLVKEHLLSKCASFQAFRAKMPPEQQPLWMLDRMDGQVLKSQGNMQSKDQDHDEKAVRRSRGRKWLLDEELLLLAAWKAKAEDWDSWSFLEKVHGEYVRRLVALKTEETGAPQSTESFLPSGAKTGTAGGLDVCNPLFSPRSQSALGQKMRQMKLSYVFMAGWTPKSEEDSASWFSLPPARQAELLRKHKRKPIREPCYHALVEIDECTKAAARARESTSVKRTSELSIELVAVPKVAKLAPKPAEYK